MRQLFDVVKGAIKKLDGYWIENAGHPIVIYGAIEIDKAGEGAEKIYIEDKYKFKNIYSQPILIYGIYEYPSTPAMRAFGIDEPDELNIEVNCETLLEKLKMLPKIGTLLKVEEADWIVIGRNWVYNKFIGKKRLNLTCQRYQESTTSGIHMKTVSGHTIEMNNET
jgi:hypothetical protein